MPSIITQPGPPLTWQQELARAYTSPAQLLADLDLEPDSWSRNAESTFSFLVPRPFAQRMTPQDPDDPLLLQVLPRFEENKSPPGFVGDPVGDEKAQVAPGLLHKYHGRVLLIVNGACAIHCRYCFRREFPYSVNRFTSSRRRPVLDYIRNDPSIEEVILSGGDPLFLSNERLDSLIHDLQGIPNLRRLRIHTRLPVVVPGRVDTHLLEMLIGCRLPVTMVLHINHANEIDNEVSKAVQRLRDCGVYVLNQSTLLAGVNDTVEALVELQKKSFDAGILPYYLHLLDRARGTSHFEVSEATAKYLHERIRRLLPGYLIPRLARDQSESPYKIIL